MPDVRSRSHASVNHAGFRSVRRHVSVLLCLGLAWCLPATADEAPGAWSGQLTPYAWGAGLEGRITPFAGAPTVRIDKSFSEVFEDLDGAFFLTGYARRDRLVLLGDVSYSASSKQGQVPPGIPGEGRVRQTSLTLGAGGRVFAGERVVVDLLGGLRHWRIRGEVDVPLAGLARSPSLDFTDPLLAVRANATLGPRWSAIGYADVGGFGAGSDLTTQWAATFNYRHSEQLYFSLGFRRLDVDYRDGGTRVDVALSGPLLGATWRF